MHQNVPLPHQCVVCTKLPSHWPADVKFPFRVKFLNHIPDGTVVILFARNNTGACNLLNQSALITGGQANFPNLTFLTTSGCGGPYKFSIVAYSSSAIICTQYAGCITIIPNERSNNCVAQNLAEPNVPSTFIPEPILPSAPGQVGPSEFSAAPVFNRIPLHIRTDIFNKIFRILYMHFFQRPQN